MKPRNGLLTIVIVATVFTLCSAVVSTAAVDLKDGEECKKGADCTCVHVTCNPGCQCDITVGLGICTHCPIAVTPAGVVIAVALSPDLHKRAVLAAQEENAATEDLIHEAVREYLDRRDRKAKGKKQY